MSLVTKLGTKLRVTKLLLNFTKPDFEKFNNFNWSGGLVVTKLLWFSSTPFRGTKPLNLVKFSKVVMSCGRLGRINIVVPLDGLGVGKVKEEMG